MEIPDFEIVDRPEDGRPHVLLNLTGTPPDIRTSVGTNLELVGQRYAELVDSDEPMCHVAILNSASKIAMSAMLYRRIYYGHNDAYDYFDPKAPDIICTGGLKSVLVDNTVHSGETLRTTASFLGSIGMLPDTFVKLVDYGDDHERLIQSWMTKGLGFKRVISLYTIEEIRSAQKLWTPTA